MIGCWRARVGGWWQGLIYTSKPNTRLKGYTSAERTIPDHVATGITRVTPASTPGLVNPPSRGKPRPIRRWLGQRRLRHKIKTALDQWVAAGKPVALALDAPSDAPGIGTRDWWRAQGDYPHGQAGSDHGHGPFDEIAVAQWLHAETMSRPGDENPGEPPDPHQVTVHLASWRLEVTVHPDGTGTLALMEWDSAGPPPPIPGVHVDSNVRTGLLRDLDDLDRILDQSNRKENGT